jgi:two-component system sensor histidine kinase KdpD
MLRSLTADFDSTDDRLERLVRDVRWAFDLDGIAVLVNHGAGWSIVTSGKVALSELTNGSNIEPATGTPPPTYALVVPGRLLEDEDYRALRAIADQHTIAVDADALVARAADTDPSKQVNALRAALLLAVSHDFRTPITTIKAYVSGFLQPDVTWSADELDEAHSAIDAECDRLNYLVGNLLDAGRLQTGVLVAAMRPTAIEELIGVATASLPSVRVICAGPADIPLVQTDPTLLARVLANLIANADHYSPASVPIEIDVQLVEGRVRVHVVDHGPGIAEDRREAVFQPFQRFNDTKSKGTGLGLAITRGFVEVVGATLTLEDTPGGGLTATVTLPVAESSESHA